MPVEARALYTAFSLFLLIGYASSLWLYADGIGFSRASAVRWYRGGEATMETGTSNDAKGPALDIPDEGAVPAVSIEKPKRQMMETFHFHLFSMPVVLLIIGHLFMLCRLSPAWKISVIAASSLATLGHLFAPLLVRFVSAKLVFLLPATGLLMAVGWTYMTLHPIFEMWRPRPKSFPRRGNESLDHVHEPTPRL